MFKSPQVLRWASATWCPSPWTTGCGGVPPLERSLKHRQLWSTIYRTLGFSHQTLGWLFDASNAGGSPSSGLNSCWLMMNNSLGISWDIVTIVGYKTSNIREMSALFSAQQIDETDRTCRPVSKRLVSQKTGDPVVVLETRFSRRFRGRFLLSTMDRVDARRSRCGHKGQDDDPYRHTDIQTYIQYMYTSWILNTTDMSEYFPQVFSFCFSPKVHPFFQCLAFVFRFPRPSKSPQLHPSFFQAFDSFHFFSFFFFSDSDSFLYSYIFFPMFCPFSFKKTTSSKPAELRPRTAKMLQMKDNDEGNSQDDFTENDLHMLPMWNISLQDGRGESMRSWDDTGHQKYGESVGNISTICILD